MSDFTCPKCSAPLQEKDFNLELAVAKCEHCHSWSSIDVSQPNTPEPAPTKKPLADIPLLNRFEIKENDEILEISWGWSTGFGVFLVVPLIVIFLMIPYSCTSMSSSTRIHSIETSGNVPQVIQDQILQSLPGHVHRSFPTHRSSSMPGVFILFCVVIGAFILYSVAANILNTTTVKVTHHKISVTHEPVPAKGQLEIDVDQLKQLYCMQTFSTDKNSTTTHYHVHALLKNDRDLKLISKLDSLKEAVYLEHKIEQYLGIEDTPVAGEIG